MCVQKASRNVGRGSHLGQGGGELGCVGAGAVCVVEEQALQRVVAVQQGYNSVSDLLEERQNCLAIDCLLASTHGLQHSQLHRPGRRLSTLLAHGQLGARSQDCNSHLVWLYAGWGDGSLGAADAGMHAAACMCPIGAVARISRLPSTRTLVSAAAATSSTSSARGARSPPRICRQ